MPSKTNGYRHAHEFYRQHDRPVEPDQAQQWLRVFRDAAGFLRAGLYSSRVPVQNDNWANGEALTDELDFVMASKTLEERGSDDTPNIPTEQLENVLLSIAYKRLYLDTKTPRNIHVPSALKEWTVKTPNTFSYNRELVDRLMASDEKTTTTTAAILLFDTVRKTGVASTTESPEVAERRISAAGRWDR